MIDCNKSILKTFGAEVKANRPVKFHLELRLDSKDQGSEKLKISYEKSGVIGGDIFLILMFFGILVATFQKWKSLNLKYDLENSPAGYCMAAMAFQLISLIFDLMHWV